jgi:hypothetical protein
MTGFVNGASYTFYAWANNTDGEWDEETVTFTVLIPATPPPPPPPPPPLSGHYRTIIWVLADDINTTAKLETFCEWAKTNYFNAVNILNEISAENRTYLQNQGFFVYKNCFPMPSCLPNYYYLTEYNLTETMQNFVTAYSGYDGIILDDSHNAWRYAHNITMFENDYVYYQWLIDNATNILVPHFGSDNVSLIMYIGGDDCNFTKMPQINCTGLTFSYYYPSDPVFRYYGPASTCGEDWYYGIFCNMSTNAWNIKEHYDQYGLNSYYRYEGWIWCPSADADMKAETLVQTFNGIQHLREHYSVNNLQVGFHWTLINNTKLTQIIRYINKAFLENAALDPNVIYVEDWNSTYWTETFDTLPINQTEETYLGWQLTSNQENYTYTCQDGMFVLDYNGTNNVGWAGFALERMLRIERNLNINLKFVPVSDGTHHGITVKEGSFPNNFAYNFFFAAFTHALVFQYKGVDGTDVIIDLGTWTPNAVYDITFNISLTSCYVQIKSGSLDWNYTIPQNNMKYNSLKVAYIRIADIVGESPTELNYKCFKVDYAVSQPLDVWNPPFEFLNYTAYHQDGFYLFLEDGLLANWTYDPVQLSASMCLYGETASNLILNCTEPTSVLGNILGYSFLGDKLTIELSAPSSSQSVSVSWKPVYVEPVPPLTLPDFLPYLWAGDFFGFIIAVYTSSFGSVDIFFGVVIMLVMVPLYIRTKSLMFMSILWILLGSLFLIATPLISGLAVLLLVLGIGSMLFELFMINRRG